MTDSGVDINWDDLNSHKFNELKFACQQFQIPIRAHYKKKEIIDELVKFKKSQDSKAEKPHKPSVMINESLLFDKVVPIQTRIFEAKPVSPDPAIRIVNIPSDITHERPKSPPITERREKPIKYKSDMSIRANRVLNILMDPMMIVWLIVFFVCFIYAIKHIGI